jgi:hypothetical protein
VPICSKEIDITDNSKEEYFMDKELLHTIPASNSKEIGKDLHSMEEVTAQVSSSDRIGSITYSDGFEVEGEWKDQRPQNFDPRHPLLKECIGNNKCTKTLGPMPQYTKSIRQYKYCETCWMLCHNCLRQAPEWVNRPILCQCEAC